MMYLLLLVGMRSGAKEKPEVSKWSEILCSAEDPVRAFHRHLHPSREEIKRVTVDGYYNLFARVQLGGLGVEAPGAVVDQAKFTFSQQLMAGAALHRLKSRVSGYVAESTVRTGFESQVLRVFRG